MQGNRLCRIGRPAGQFHLRNNCNLTSATIAATIDRLGRKGEGIALLDGRSVFVAFALPGLVGTSLSE